MTKQKYGKSMGKKKSAFENKLPTGFVLTTSKKSAIENKLSIGFVFSKNIVFGHLKSCICVCDQVVNWNYLLNYF